MKLFFRKSSLLVLALSALPVACSNDDDDNDSTVPAPSETTPSLSLTGALSQDQRFSTLNAAVKAAGLEETLSSGTFTIFAPTNEAFAKLGAETINALLADKEALKNILLYHAVAGRVPAGDVLKSSSLEAANGLSLTPTLVNSEAFINKSKIIETDIVTSNGIVHAIDTVLVPDAVVEKSVVDTLKSDGRFSVLLTAVEAAGLVDALNSSEITLFAPTDAAFAKVPAASLNALIADKEALKTVLLTHAAASQLKSGSVLELSSVTTLSGKNLAIEARADGAYVGGSKISQVDLTAKGAVIHVIDSVILQ